MKAPLLSTNHSRVRLIEPDVRRDAALGVRWLNGEHGRVTMQLMGNSEETLRTILPTTLEQETARVQEFLDRQDQLNWMIEYQDTVVGSVWVDLSDSKHLPAPSVHIMIGDPDMRGKSIGSSAVGLVLEYLDLQGRDVIYSRHIMTNTGSYKLLKSLGFRTDGKPYISGTLEFQNLIREK